MNAVSINTTATSGTDPTNNTVRNYKLNIQGDVNFNGTLYQDNQEFVTSRWTDQIQMIFTEHLKLVLDSLLLRIQKKH